MLVLGILSSIIFLKIFVGVSDKLENVRLKLQPVIPSDFFEGPYAYLRTVYDVHKGFFCSRVFFSIVW